VTKSTPHSQTNRQPIIAFGRIHGNDFVRESGGAMCSGVWRLRGVLAWQTGAILYATFTIFRSVCGPL
jgi:hypothetical protein